MNQANYAVHKKSQEDISFEDLVNITCEQALKRLLGEKKQLVSKTEEENQVGVVPEKTPRDTQSWFTEQVPPHVNKCVDDYKSEDVIINIDEDSEDTLVVDPKLLLIPAVSTTKLEDMDVIEDESFGSIKNKYLIELIDYLSNPVKQKNKSLENVGKDGCIIIESSDDDDDEDDNINEAQKVKLTSGLFKKPHICSYNSWDLYKNPDFNATHKNLNPDFYSFSRNIEMMNCCKRLTIDLSKSFESKLVNGRIYLKDCGENMHNETNTENTEIQPHGSLIGLDCPTDCKPFLNNINANLSSRNIIEAKEFSEIQAKPERNTIINLPNKTEIRRINQNLLTAEVSPVQTHNGLQPPLFINPVKPQLVPTERNIADISLNTLNFAISNPSISSKPITENFTDTNLHISYKDSTHPVPPLAIIHPKKFIVYNFPRNGTNTKLLQNPEQEYITERNELVSCTNNDSSRIRITDKLLQRLPDKVSLNDSNSDTKTIEPHVHNYRTIYKTNCPEHTDSPAFTDANYISDNTNRETSSQNSNNLLLPSGVRVMLNQRKEVMYLVNPSPDILLPHQQNRIFNSTAALPNPTNIDFKKVISQNKYAPNVPLAGTEASECVKTSQPIVLKTNTEKLKDSTDKDDLTPRVDTLKHTHGNSRAIHKANFNNFTIKPATSISNQNERSSVFANPETNERLTLNEPPIFVRIAPKLIEDQVNKSIVKRAIINIQPKNFNTESNKNMSRKEVAPKPITSINDVKIKPMIGIMEQNTDLKTTVANVDLNLQKILRRSGPKGIEESRKRVYKNNLNVEQEPKRRKYINLTQSRNQLTSILKTSCLKMSPEKSNEEPSNDSSSWLLLGL